MKSTLCLAYGLALVVALMMPAVAQEGQLDKAEPKGTTTDEIIRRFADKEKEFAIARDQYTYRQDVTEIDTPIAAFVEAGVGVCQDYTHAMLAVCRMLGIPSRYVSGYLETSPGLNLGSDASHAWVEAYLPGSGWVGFDPTNGVAVGQTYVKVGHGRDYDDVPPVKGLRRGGGTESLRVAVSVLRAPETGASAASTA